jgi:hypothetical protein
MEFLNSLGINTTSGIIGSGLLVIGAFLILAGIGIISIQQITVKQGKATWIVGFILAAFGGFLIYPDFAAPKSPEGQTEVQAGSLITNSDVQNALSDWRTISFILPGDGLWQEDGGRYSAIGSKDTIAWSEEMLAGDVEISLDIESSSSYGAATIIVYGNGRSMASGNLIFTIASDLQAILADSIYDNGTYLFDTLATINMENQKHQVRISIIDRKASFFLDGDEISSVFLDDEINSSGRIGLLKYWEIHDITFSNVRVRSTEP